MIEKYILIILLVKIILQGSFIDQNQHITIIIMKCYKY
jgi:hypothetical protein